MNLRKFAMRKNKSLLAEEASATAMMTKASGLFCFMFLLFLHQSFNTVVAQPGFISLDCGGDQEYTDSNNITWIPDNTSFVQTGSVATLPTANNQSSIPQSLTRLRYFPNNQSKNCYTLPANLSTRYLIRATFLYGNYDGATTNPIFDICLDATIWATITILNATETYYQEIVAIAQSRSSTFSVCLLNVNQGTPFLSSLELRPLFGAIYGRPYMSAAYLSSMLRINFGAPSFASVRYPYDPVDRIWMSDQAALAETTSLLQNVGSNVTSISTTRSVRVTSASDQPPQLVMQTAAVGNNGILSYRSRLDGFPSQAYAVSYFAEIQVLKPTDIRSFIFNTNIADPTFVDQNLNLQQDAQGSFIAFEPGYPNVTIPQYVDYSLIRTSNSTLNPIINALEIYKIVTKISTTNYADVLALSSLASQLPPQHSQGDPCLPVAWDWVLCNSASPPQVTTIDLSNKNLSGTIPNSLATMTALQSISLDYNNFTGPIPDLSSLSSLQFLNLEDNGLSGDFPQWLANLPSLTVLWVDNNNLTGSVPQSLLNRAGLQTRFYDNPFLCTNTSCMTNLPKSHTNVVAVVAGVVGGVLALFLVLGAVGTCFYCRHIQQLPKGGSTKISLIGVMSSVTDATSEAVESMYEEQSTLPAPAETSFDQARYFQLPELKAATNNFTTKIGEGGFGPVYYGKTKENQEIAVKVLAGDSRQGAREFSNEVTLLSRVHHRNLVAMIGYCQHAKDRILVYEYMPNGSLHDCLHGPSAVSDPLDWMTRLNIAHDAAKGLEYLHTGCSPGIIHRDVKSSNILLTNKMVAKVSDFGLSKLTSDEFTHISSTIQGTIGYLDPEYYQLQQLTMKSDVYSFGVVLLELISGREPISPKQIDFSIVTWARGLLQRGDIESIVDPALGQFYSSESMWKFAELAVSCVEPSSFHRPAMCDVFQGILEAIKLETGMSMNASDPRSTAASLATCAISPGYFDNDYLGVSVGAPDGNKFLFANENKLVQNSWPSHVKKLFGPNSLMNKTGEQHKHARRMFTSFFGPDSLQRFVPRMDKMVRAHFVQFWEGKDEIMAFAIIKQSAFALAADLLFSITDGPQFQSLARDLFTLSQGIAQPPLDFPGTSYHNAKLSRNRILCTLDTIICQRRKDMEEGKVSSQHDLLSVMISTLDQDQDQLATNEDIKDNVLLFLFAGYETTVSTLAGALKYLFLNPQCLQKVIKEQKEIAIEKAGSSLNWDDTRKMKYTWQVMQECLRIQPTVEVGFRECIKEFEYEGFTIPKGWRLFWHLGCSHMSPKFFPNPERFDPDRFEGLGPPPFSYMPFGGGPRTCLGVEFARTQMVVFLHYLVLNYEWNMVDPNEGVVRNPHPMFQKGLPLKIRKKQPLESH